MIRVFYDHGASYDVFNKYFMRLNLNYYGCFIVVASLVKIMMGGSFKPKAHVSEWEWNFVVKKKGIQEKRGSSSKIVKKDDYSDGKFKSQFT